MKRIMSMLLVLMLAMLPALSMADEVNDALEKALENGRAVTTEISVTPGSVPGVDEQLLALISDVCKAVKVTSYHQNGQCGFAVNMSDEPVLSGEIMDQDGAVYVSGNFLGDKPVRLSVGDATAVLRLFYEQQLSDQAAKGAMTEEQVKEALDTFDAQLEKMMGLADSAVLPTLDLSDLNLTNTLKAVMALLEQVEVEEDPAMQPNGCDPAKTKVSMTLTGEQVAEAAAALLEDLKGSANLMAMFDSMLQKLELPPMADLMDALIQKVRAAESLKAFAAPVVIYTDEAGEPVYMEVSCDLADEAGKGMVMKETCARLTLDDGVHNTIVWTAVQDGDEANAVAAHMDIIDGANTVINFTESIGGTEFLQMTMVDAVEQGEQAAAETCDVEIRVTDPDSKQSVSAHVTTVANSAWSDADAQREVSFKLYLNGSAEEIGVLTVRVASADAVPALDAANAVTFQTMTMEDLSGWLGGLIVNAQRQLLGMLQLLPDSALALVMGN